MIPLERYIGRVYVIEICAYGGPCVDQDCDGEQHQVIEVVPRGRLLEAELGRDLAALTIDRVRDENRAHIKQNGPLKVVTTTDGASA